MATLIEKRREMNECLDQSIQLALKIGAKTSAETLKKIKENFSKKEIMVVTVGEMRRGKSSMLNALLGEKDPIFPVDTNVCTNVVTIVGYGKEEAVEVLYNVGNDLRKLRSENITRGEIADYVSERGNPNNYKNVSVLNIRIPNPLLKDGVKFVDTPGVGSLNISHAETTYGFLPNADLLLYVSDAASGLTETELNFLKKGYNYCKNVVFPLTKKDLNPNYKEIMEDNRSKIAKTLEIDRSEIEIIPVSSTAKMRSLVSKNPAMLKNSNFEELENTIWKTIEKKRGELLFIPFIAEAEQELYKIAENIAAQYQLMKSDKEKLTEYAKRLNEEIEKLKKLRSDNSKWKNDISYKFDLMRNDNSSAIGRIKLNAHNILEARCNEYGAKICDENVYTAVYREINDAISADLLEIKENMTDEAMSVFSKMSSDLGLDSNACIGVLESLEFRPNDSFEVQFPKRKVIDKVMAGGGKIARGSMSGGKIGSLVGIAAGIGLALLAGPAVIAAEVGVTAAAAIIGTAVGGSVIGSSAGAALGGAKGCIDAVVNRNDVDIVHVKKAFSLHIDDSMNLINRLMGEAYIKLKNAIVNEIDDKINRKADELQENIKQIEENMKSAKPDTEKLAGLKATSDAVNKMIGVFEKQRKGLDYIESEPKPAPKPEKSAPSEKKKDDMPEYNFL